MPKVKYMPGEGDYATTKWNGVTFRANEWVDLDDKKHWIEVTEMLPGLDKDGQRILKPVNRKVPMSELARTNQFFEVEGETTVEEKRRGRPKTPETAEEYLAYAGRWISAGDDPDEMRSRWRRENALRERLGAADAVAEQLYDQLVQRIEALRVAA